VARDFVRAIEQQLQALAFVGVAVRFDGQLRERSDHVPAITALERRLLAWHKANLVSQRLAQSALVRIGGEPSLWRHWVQV
jgi:hypothetical protein